MNERINAMVPSAEDHVNALLDAHLGMRGIGPSLIDLDRPLLEQVGVLDGLGQFFNRHPDFLRVVEDGWTGRDLYNHLRRFGYSPRQMNDWLGGYGIAFR